MVITKGQYGQYCITDIQNNKLIKKQYYFYTKKQAIKKFKQEFKIKQ